MTGWAETLQTDTAFRISSEPTTDDVSSPFTSVPQIKQVCASRRSGEESKSPNCSVQTQKPLRNVVILFFEESEHLTFGASELITIHLWT